MKSKPSFKSAVEQTAEIKDAYKTGLKALTNTERQHVEARDTTRLTGSVNIDKALKHRYPDERRWDYAIGYQPTKAKNSNEVVYWIEIHPAKDGEVSVVLAKLKWLQAWLTEKAPALNAMPREFIWISSGKTSFTLTAPQRRKFAEHGLQHTGRVFTIPDGSP